MTWSTRCGAVGDSQRAPHDGQNPRRLQLKASSLSWPHSPQRSLVPRSQRHLFRIAPPLAELGWECALRHQAATHRALAARPARRAARARQRHAAFFKAMTLRCSASRSLFSS
jgi:hypothetical protein